MVHKILKQKACLPTNSIKVQTSCLSVLTPSVATVYVIPVVPIIPGEINRAGNSEERSTQWIKTSDAQAERTLELFRRLSHRERGTRGRDA